MPVSPIGSSDPSSTHRAAETPGASSDPATTAATPSATPTPSHPVSQLLDSRMASRMSASAPTVSRAIKQADGGTGDAPETGNASSPDAHSLTLGEQVSGFAHGAAQATGNMASGLWDMAKGAAKLSPMSYAAEKLSDATGLNAYHGFSTTAASAQKTVHAIASNPGGVLKAAVEPYRSAWQAGKYGEAIGMGTVDAVSLLADGVGEAGKVGEAASAAGKVGEAASVAGKAGEAANAAGKVGEATSTATNVGEAANTATKTSETLPTADTLSEGTTTTTTTKPLKPGSNEALAPGAKNAAATRPANTTRHGVVRTNTADWRSLRDLWDQLGYGDILSDSNRSAIARGRTPKVDDAWISVFPEDAGLKGERISMHHIGGSPVTVPLPATRHLDAHMPGGFRHNPGGPGSALPFYPPKPTGE